MYMADGVGVPRSKHSNALRRLTDRAGAIDPQGKSRGLSNPSSPAGNEKPADAATSTGSEIKAGSFDRSTATRKGHGAQAVPRSLRGRKARQERETVWYVATGKPFVWPPRTKPARPIKDYDFRLPLFVFEYDHGLWATAYPYGSDLDAWQSDFYDLSFGEALTAALRLVNDRSSRAFGRRIHIGWGW